MQRVTNIGITSSVLGNNQKTLSRLATYQEQLSSGKRVNRMSDDPVAGKIAVGHRKGVFEADKYLDNISKSSAFMQATDATMGEMSRMLENVKDLAVQGANGTQDANSRTALSQQVNALLDRMIDLGNTQHDGRYVFSGTATAQRPFARSDDDSRVDYSGNLDDFTVQIGPSSAVVVNQNGNDLFKTSVDIFDSLVDLRDALKNNDGPKVATLIDRVDAAAEHVIVQHGNMGGRMQRLELARNQLEDTQVQLRQLMSDAEDVDLTKTLTDFQLANTALEAGLQVGARVMQTSLIDFLR